MTSGGVVPVWFRPRTGAATRMLRKGQFSARDERPSVGSTPSSLRFRKCLARALNADESPVAGRLAAYRLSRIIRTTTRRPRPERGSLAIRGRRHWRER
jgi:hypothetical protein